MHAWDDLEYLKGSRKKKEKKGRGIGTVSDLAALD